MSVMDMTPLQQEMQMHSRLVRAIFDYPGSQAELCRKAGVSDSSLSLYIRRNRFPHLLQFAGLCQALGEDPRWILGLTDEREDEMEKTPKIVMERVQEMVRKTGLSYEQLAIKMGVHKNTVARWMSGEKGISVSALLELCKITGDSIAWAVGEEERREL